MKILIAEDQRDVGEMLKMLLETRGHSVNVAVNGEEAVNMAIRNPPDVVLMDLQMPVMDGITATRLLRTRPETEKVPVIGLSAYLGDAAWQKGAFEAGCIECLSKPLELKRFEDLLARLPLRTRDRRT